MNALNDDKSPTIPPTPRCRVERINTLAVFRPTTLVSSHATRLPKELRSRSTKLLQQREPESDAISFNHFPLLVDPDEVPWPNGNRYLLSKVKQYVPPKARTLESIASDLAHFRTWCLEHDVDYLKSTGRFRVRPTYRYSLFLHELIRGAVIQPRTAKRRQNSVINFYRWLIECGQRFDEPLWQENSTEVAFTDGRGFRRFKGVVTNDISRSFRVNEQADPYSEYINDGEKLRPLRGHEQEALVESLIDIGNTEMLLGFLIALSTGARMQTVFTLRRQHFDRDIDPDGNAVRIEIGHGTLIENKAGKRMVLHVPALVYCKVRTYLASERAQNRHQKAAHVITNKAYQYAFLTRAGRPYYIHKSDPLIASMDNPPAGNAVRQFIYQQLEPHLRVRGKYFKVRFHDLRATFGMNLLEARLNQTTSAGQKLKSDTKLSDALNYVMTRMGHSKPSTTEAYLNYGKNHAISLELQANFEQYLEHLL